MKALVVIDIQREYTTPERRFHIKSIDSSLKQAGIMLSHARSEQWPIIHVRHMQSGEIFNSTSPFSDFVSGFLPIAGEAEAIKDNFSCFSSRDFAHFMEEHATKEFLVVGYGTTMCCLSTVIDGYHRGYKFALVEDACAARASGVLSEDSMHQHAVAIMAPFARITSANLEAEAMPV